MLRELSAHMTLHFISSSVFNIETKYHHTVQLEVRYFSSCSQNCTEIYRHQISNRVRFTFSKFLDIKIYIFLPTSSHWKEFSTVVYRCISRVNRYDF